MKVSELTGEQLDYWVAKAEGYVHHGAVGLFERNDSKPWCLSEVNDWWKDPEGRWICGPCTGFPYSYSTEWERGGPIIARERIDLLTLGEHGWQAYVNPDASEHWCLKESEGPTPLIAAMRAHIAAKFGEELPDTPT